METIDDDILEQLFEPWADEGDEALLQQLLEPWDGEEVATGERSPPLQAGGSNACVEPSSPQPSTSGKTDKL